MLVAEGNKYPKDSLRSLTKKDSCLMKNFKVRCHETVGNSESSHLALGLESQCHFLKLARPDDIEY